MQNFSKSWILCGAEIMEEQEEKYATIPDSGKWDTPMDETHFWNWLMENKDKHPRMNTIEVKRDYLQSLGLVLGVDFISPRDVELLKHIMEYFCFKVMRPIWA